MKKAGPQLLPGHEGHYLLLRLIAVNSKFIPFKIDALVKSLKIVMPDLIRHPERIDFTGFRLSPE